MNGAAGARPSVVAALPSRWWEWLLWVAFASLVVSRLLQWGGTPNQWVAMWQALLPWQFIAVVPVTLFAAYARRWRAALALLAVWLSLVPLMAAWQFHGARVSIDEPNAFTIATANILYSNENLSAAFDDVAATSADVIVLSEVTSSASQELQRHEVLGAYPYRSTDPFAIGVAVISRYPMEINGEGTWTSGESQAVVLDVGGRPVRLIASHPPPPVFNSDIWSAELEVIGNDVEASATPTVVAGDLNAGWVLPPFREMIEVGDLTDAMAASGRPWTMTWPAEPFPRFPFVTLDHILVTDPIGVIDAEAFAVTGSDHKGLVANVALVEE